MLRVMFLCVGNSCRSQMAEGFARHHGQGVLEARSGGTRPAGAVDPTAIAVMKERGIDIAGHVSKPVDLAFADAADRLYTMGCRAEEACPARLWPRIVDWPLPDPVGRPVETFRDVRDQIEARVRTLVDEARSSGH